MTALRVILSRLGGLLFASRRDRRLRLEIEAHLAHLADEYGRRGLSPHAARAAARRDFGGVDQLREAHRDQRGIPAVASLAQDLTHAIRLLGRQPGATTLAVVTLALGIGVSSTAFTIVNAICIRGLPIEQPERVLFVGSVPARGEPTGVSYLDYQDLRRSSRSFAGLAAFAQTSSIVADEDRAPERVNASYVSAGAFALLDQQPLLGREFEPSDEVAGAAPVAILGGRLWRSRYAAAADVIGRSIRIDGTWATVVGVMEEGFRFPANAVLWQPLPQMPGLTAQTRDARGLGVFGRLASGISIAAAQTELAAVAASLAGVHASTNRGVSIRTVPINEQFTGRLTDSVWLAFLTAGHLVLLVACANLANLLLMRGLARRRELAIRAAIGASRLRLLRQLLIESAALAALAGGAGLGLSVAAVTLLDRSVPAALPLPYWIDFSLDWRVLAFVIIVCVSAVVLSGLVPALHTSGARGDEAMAGRQLSSLADGRAHRWTAGLLAVQFALALVLLSNIAVAVRQSWRIQRTEMPIDASRLLTGRVTLPRGAYPDGEARSRFYADLSERLAAVENVTSIALTSNAPFSGGVARPLAIAGRPVLPGQPAPAVLTITVSPTYFDTLGLQAVGGRTFGALDGTPGHETILINERLAELFFPDEEAIGHRVRLGEPGNADVGPWLSIIGVVPNVRQRPGPFPDPVAYVPLRLDPPPSAVLIVRSSFAAPASLTPAVREVVRQLDPDLPLDRALPMEQALRDSGWNARVSARILFSMSGIAFVLGLVGLYALTSYGVAQRSREIGIRVALGARPGDMAWLVVRRVLIQVGGGVALGFLFTLAFHAAFSAVEGPERPTDPATFLPLVAIVTLVSLAACAAPILRAARVDPAVTLRLD